MKILLSALGCEPGKGSELEVGYRALLAAASRHEVWVLTNSATVPVVRRAIEHHPWASRVHFEGIYFEVDDQLYPRLSAPGFHWYYDRWQRRASERAAILDAQVDFDVVHHVTLAANWTRAGVTVVEKPLVWGPVGGGVEMPLSLFPELGWRGVVEEASRFAARRILASIGSARTTEERAAVIFAQNTSTVRIIRTDGRLRLLPNATSVDVQHVRVSGTRRKDIIFAARLLPWKGGRLAVRAFRYVEDPEAVLRVFGVGPERARIARAARRWGIADRIRFEGRVSRDELLELVATAGALLHPAFHDEAGLSVAEALSLGTPVVCLDHGGPPELLRQWPGASAEAVRPQSPQKTARGLAAAIDRFLADPPPLRPASRPSVTSFEQELLRAYEVAYAIGLDRVRRTAKLWAFPAGKPQVFADEPRKLSNAIMVYGFGRRLPRWIQRGLALQVRLPLVRRLLAEPKLEPPPVCGWSAWRAILDEVQQRHAGSTLEWIHFRSQWGKDRSSVLGLNLDGTSRVFVVVERTRKNACRSAVQSTPSFRVTACTGSFCYEDWSVREYEPLPRLHRPARWDSVRMLRVAQDISRALESVLLRPDGVPLSWRPMHGDYVPWNLREAHDGQLWLLDWEDAAWGPPMADLVRYVVAYYSLGWASSRRIATLARNTLRSHSLTDGGLAEAAAFWLTHPNLQPGRHDRALTRRRSKDLARAAREIGAFRILAAGTGSGIPKTAETSTAVAS